jgi:hypothetical protein
MGYLFLEFSLELSSLMFSKQAGKSYSKLKIYILKFLNYHMFLLDFSNSNLYDIKKNSGDYKYGVFSFSDTWMHQFCFHS